MASTSLSPASASTALEEDDDDKFAEDECTIEFGEEDLSASPPASATTSVLSAGRVMESSVRAREYPGEDFSCYLEEQPAPDYDMDIPPPFQPPTPQIQSQQTIGSRSGTAVLHGRYQKKSLSVHAPIKSPSSTSSLPSTSPESQIIEDLPSSSSTTTTSTMSRPQFYTSTSPSVSPEGRRKSLSSIRERLGRFFSTIGSRSGRSGKDSRSRLQSATIPGTLHNFSFADSKIGILLAAEQQRQTTVLPAGDRGDGSTMMETCSDVGTTRQSWWDVGTLSSAHSSQMTVSSKASSNSSSQTRHKSRWALFHKLNSSQSVPNLLDSNSNDDKGLSLSGGVRSPQHRSTSSSRSGKEPLSDVQNTSTRSVADSPTLPPPLPPLRREPASGTGKLPKFLQRLTEAKSHDGDNQKRERSREQTRRKRTNQKQEPIVSTLSYRRTYEEIPVQM